MTHSTTTIGIDVSKQYLDAFCQHDQQTLRVPNQLKGITALLAWIDQRQARPLIVIEPTGGYEHPLQALLLDQGFALVAVMRKMLVRLNAKMREYYLQGNGSTWQPQ